MKRFSLGAIDPLIIQHFYPAETDAAQHGFRWTDGDSTLVVPSQGLGSHVLGLTLSASLPDRATVPVTITVNGGHVLLVQQSATPRHYALLVDRSTIRANTNVIRIQSPTFHPQLATDIRTLGVAVFTVEWQVLASQPELVPLQVLVLMIASTLLLLALAITHIPLLPRLALVGLFIVSALAMRYSDTHFIYRVHAIQFTIVLALLLSLGCIALRYRRSAIIRLPIRDWLSFHWRSFIGYVIVTGVMLYPLVYRMTNHIIGFPGDAYEYLWKMQWFSDALTQQHTSPLFVPQLLYPAGFELAYSEITPAHTLLGLPFTWLFGAIISYNLLIIASFILTGFCTYLLACRLGASRAAAWVAGLIFAFTFRRYIHSVGHLPMMSTQWLALALYGWEGVVTRRRAWDGYVSGLGIALASWSSWYFGSTLICLLACYTLVRPGIKNLPGLVQSWRAIVLAVVVTIPLILFVAQPYIELRQQGVPFQHSLGEVRAYSVLPQDYLLPNPWHPLWGAWAKQFQRPAAGENVAVLGYSVIVLALAGIWLARQRRIVLALVVVLIINVVASFGPMMRLSEDTWIPMPILLVYHYVPVLNGLRTWSRMVLYVALCCGLLAGLGLSGLPTRWYRWTCGIAVALVLFESAVAFPVNAPGPRAVDVWLRHQPGPGAVIELPNGAGGPAEYFSLFSRRPNNLWYGSYDPPLYTQELYFLQSFPDMASLRLMQRWQTKYIVIDDAAMNLQRSAWRQELDTQPVVQWVYSSEGYSVYQMVYK